MELPSESTPTETCILGLACVDAFIYIYAILLAGG